jgi:hypothetical protein
MIHAIDHVVILVSDLTSASADYTAFGFTVVPGGEHAGGATHNALVVFADDSYLELIAFKRSAPEHHWWRHVALGEGIIDFALLPSMIEADIAAARERGLTIEGPYEGGRLRPDGERIAWQTGRASTADLPFLCGDVTPRALRVPGGAIRQHANGASGIASVLVAVADLGASATRYRALLGVPEREAVQVGAAPPGTRAAAFMLGAAEITLAMPGEALDSPLRERLMQRGEGPFALTLRTSAQAAPISLDLARTHGARIEMLGT